MRKWRQLWHSERQSFHCWGLTFNAGLQVPSESKSFLQLPGFVVKGLSQGTAIEISVLQLWFPFHWALQARVEAGAAQDSHGAKSKLETYCNHKTDVCSDSARRSSGGENKIKAANSLWYSMFLQGCAPVVEQCCCCMFWPKDLILQACQITERSSTECEICFRLIVPASKK